jgi:hypothetical protein
MQEKENILLVFFLFILFFGIKYNLNQSFINPKKKNNFRNLKLEKKREEKQKISKFALLKKMRE